MSPRVSNDLRRTNRQVISVELLPENVGE